MDFDIDQAKAPGFFRRLAALFYDLALLTGVLMIAIAVVIVPYERLTGTPFPHAEGWYRFGLQVYLLVTIGLFYTYFWVRDGQTLGMRAWRLRLVRDDGSRLRPRDALARLGWAALCLAPAGAGLLWMLLDRDHMTCYDRLSRTRPLLVSRRRKSQPHVDQAPPDS